MGKNHKGFTLVELICTIAIFSIVITGVGSAMVISARSYRNGNVELDLQQQAQITSNLLTNLIIDADRVVSASGSTLTVEKVESGVTVTYTVYLDGDQIVYQKDGSTPQTLAEHVTGFAVSNAAGNDNVDFTLQFTEGGRSYESDYHVTPRNGVTAGGASMSGTAGIYVENKLILEPGQTYDLNVRITGTSIQGFSIQNLTGSTDTTGTTVSVVDTRTARITVGAGETGTGSNASFRFRVVADDGSAAPQDVEVLVRRVNIISVNGYKTSGSVNKAGAVYKITAAMAGTNLEKEPGAWYDVNYMNPYTATWSYAYTEDDGTNITNLNFNDHFEVIEQGFDGNVPYIKIKLKNNITEGRKLVVTCTALHPEGTDGTNPTNKSGLKYGTVSGIWELEYQAWKRDGRLDIGLALDDSYFWPDTTPKQFKGNAELNIWGYASNGQLIDHPTGFNFFATTNSGAFVKVEPGYGDINTWNMVLDTQRSAGDSMAYSSPYFSYSTPHNGYWSDVVRYDIKIQYRVEYGEHAGEEVTLESSHSIEDVQIKFKNAVDADWNRTNKVYVTRADNVSTYRVYFMFDKGWEGTEYRFSDLNRFVGVVHEDADDTLDIRKDITPIEQASAGGNYYITFSLPDSEKEACMAAAAADGGIIREIYEYNPYFGKLLVDSYNGTVYYPSNSMTGAAVTSAELTAVKGCAGAVEFHFVNPNITGSTVPKVMYCPTLTEYGPVYYIDDITRFLISDTTAQYQELSGGSWVTTVNLAWNDTGWTAN